MWHVKKQNWKKWEIQEKTKNSNIGSDLFGVYIIYTIKTENKSQENLLIQSSVTIKDWNNPIIIEDCYHLIVFEYRYILIKSR